MTHTFSPARRITLGSSLIVTLLLTACASSHMSAVPLYVPKGPVNEQILGEARIGGNIAYGLYQNGQYRQALSGYQTALSNLFLIDHEQEIANIRHNLAQVWIALGEYDKAQQETEKALTANRRFGFATRLALNLSTLAVINEKRGKPDQALTLYREAIVILVNNNGSRRDLAVQYNNCGYLYLGQKKYPEALMEFHQGLRYALSDTAYSQIASAYSGIGRAQLALGQAEAAFVAFSSALNADKATEDSLSIAQDLKDIGRTLEAMLQPEKAIEYYNRALRINSSLRYFDRVRTDINDLIRVQTGLGNTKAVNELRQALRSIQ